MRDWLIKLRKKKGLTQVEVAEKAGISQPSLCDIERGVTSPRPDTAKKIAEVLDFPWTKFFE
jgi:transcriptional regulator with XRE-family HTH domain